MLDRRAGRASHARVNDPADIACILLAAGQGRRFGGGKLCADLDGRPLGLHAASMLAGIPFGAHVAVSGPDAPDFGSAGFVTVTPDALAPALSASIAAGVRAIADRGFRGVLIALADMPRVPATHIRALLAQFDGEPVATLVARRAQPPALFGHRHLADLTRLTGDRGAHSLLRHARNVELSGDAALDVDTQADLQGLASAHHAPNPISGE